VQDAQIHYYVQNLDFEHDEILGIFDRKLTLLAVAHLAYGKTWQIQKCAEFGVSVIRGCRGRGYGTMLFERAAMHAVNQGVQTMFIHALSENTAMLKIAKAAGARVLRPDLIPTQGPKLFEVEYGGASHSNSGGAHACQ
jgi:GNAT superfamily N-acetyltransferase